MLLSLRIKRAMAAAIVAAAPLASQKPPRKFELKADSPRFWELFDRSAGLEKVAGGFGFTEGPVWDGHGGFLYVSDEEQNRIYRVFPDGRKETAASLVDPDGSTLDKNHRLITTASELRAIVEVQADGTLRTLAGRYEGKRFNSPNDIVLGPDGALYFTDPTLDLPKGQKQEIPFQGVYRLASDGGVRLLLKDFRQPNGLAFSPDGKRFYVDDTERRDIRVYDVSANGEMTNGRLFGKEDGPDGVPDGMRVDANGNLYVTGPGGIWVWDPGGQKLGTILLPETAANLTWGGGDYRTLYITATHSVYRLRAKARGFDPAVHAYGPATHAAALEAGLEHFRAGRYAAARPFLEQAVALGQEDAGTWKLLGLAASSSGDLDAGANAFREACELAPRDEDACYYLARNLFALGHYEAARVPFEKALQAAPRVMQAKVHRAVALNCAAMGATAEAEQHFLKAIQQAGGPTRETEDPRVDYGAFLFRQGRTEAALGPLQQAVKEAPASARGHLELGRVLLHLEKLDAAAASLERAVRLEPANFNAHLLLGRAYLRLGRTIEGERETRLGQEGWAAKR
jgi:gluconolactonase